MVAAKLVETEAGLVPQGDGWFVVNVRDAAWLRNDYFGARTSFEAGGRIVTFPQVGVTVIVMVGGCDPEGMILYERNETALKHGAAVEQTTPDPFEAYALFPHWELGRPEGWDTLPWSD